MLVSLLLRSGLVSEMLEKNIPFSEWDHLTVLAWLEVSACTCTIHQAFNIPRANVTQLEEFRGALIVLIQYCDTHSSKFQGWGANIKQISRLGGKCQINFKSRGQIPEFIYIYMYTYERGGQMYCTCSIGRH